MAKGGFKNINKLLSELKKFGKEAENLIAFETMASAGDISLDAKQRAPKNFGKLAQSIRPQKVDKFNYKVVVGEDYGAYVEFGTRGKVRIPDEMKEEAAKFQGGRGGSFSQGLQAIKDWCKAKGIDERAAYPIFIKLLNVGMNPQPYLYPAYQKGVVEYVENLEKGLEQLIKKYN